MRITTRPFFHLLFLVFVTLCVYYPVIFSPLCSLDDSGLINSLLNMQPSGLLDYLNPVGGSHYYRPLLMLSFWADKIFWALEESFMHLENLLLHTANALIVFLSCRELIRQRGGGQWAPLLAGILFALHPVNTESVAWISGRSDLLMSFFVLVSFWTFLIVLRSGSVSLAALSCFSFFLGCASKETALFFLPGVAIFLLGVTDMKKKVYHLRWWRLKIFSAYVFSASLYLVFRLQIFSGDRGLERLSDMSRVASTPDGIDWTVIGNMIFLLVKTCGFYLLKLFWPFPLNFAITKIDDIYFYPGLLLIVVLCWLLFHRSSIACLVLTTFSVGLSALLVLFSQIAWTPFAERYLYLPGAFFCILVILWLCSLKGKIGTIALALMPVVFLGMATTTFSRCLLWQDNLKLFADTLEKSPDSDGVKGQYASALFAAGREEEAMKMFREISPDNHQLAVINKSMALSWEGDLANARTALFGILENPGVFEVHALNKIIKLTDMMVDRAETEKQKKILFRETLQWFQRLYDLTKNPFFLYRSGIVHMKLGENLIASDFFYRAFLEFPEDSIYKKPSYKLSNRLKNEAD